MGWEDRLTPDQAIAVDDAGTKLANNEIDDEEAYYLLVSSGMTAEEADEYINLIFEGTQE